MNKKLFGIIIIFFGLAIAGGIVYFIFFYKFSGPQEIVEEQKPVEQVLPVKPQEQAEPLVGAEQVNNISTTAKTEIGQEDLKRLASAFAERFGSYSNQSDYGNVRDLKIFMSLNMQNWADNYINESRAKKGDSSIYYGITTKAIATEVKQFDSDLGQAEILVKTQRREATGATNNATLFYQDIRAMLIKEGGAWKVDNAYWQNK